MTKVRVVWLAEIEPDFHSRALMWWQQAPYSHVAIVIERDGVEVICHAVGKGVCIEVFEEILVDHKVVAQRVVDLKCSSDLLLGFVEGEEGKEYSDLQLLGIAIWGQWFKSFSFFHNKNRKRICSEFVGIILQKWSSYKLEGDQDFWTPVYLEQLLDPVKFK